MESNADPENQLMIEASPDLQIDPKRARFPCCIVWTPIPVISWFIPFIGHIGICREDGVILDFAGPNFVSVDNFAFGAVARYLPISKEKRCHAFPCPSLYISEDQQHDEQPENEILTWDDAIRKSTQEFQHRSYSLFTCNCHSFVANSLNRLRFNTGGWNVVNLATLIFLKGKWVNRASMMIINFTASWCGPCRRINPFYRELAKKFPNVIFLEVDVDELMSVAEDWTVEAMPTFLFLKEGNIVDKMVGSREEELHHIIQSNISTSAEPSSSSHII
uniref:Thioredoxin domain-containing protein n=1 Tax=Cannabis sativa TaxID=3483 RepID=A0A803PFI1_CANSA